MMMITPLDSASHWLTWSNRLYIVGAIATLASAAMVLYEKRSKNKGIAVRWGLATEIIVIIAAFISLAGTVGAVIFGNRVSTFKDADLAAYKSQAAVQIAQLQASTSDFNATAAKAYENAAIANDDAAQANKSAADAAVVAGTASQTARSAIAHANDVEKRFSPMLMDADCAIHLEAVMKPLGGQPIDFLIPPNNFVIQAFAQQIGSELHRVGWTANYVFPLNGVPRDARIDFLRGDKQAGQRAEALFQALHNYCHLDVNGPDPISADRWEDTEVRFGMSMTSDNHEPTGTVHIWIGPK